jgi:hypothetical protein
MEILVGTATTGLTVGEIARQAGVPVHAVQYVARARRVKPIGRAGAARLFSEADAALILAELRKIDSRKWKASPPARQGGDIEFRG